MSINQMRWGLLFLICGMLFIGACGQANTDQPQEQGTHETQADQDAQDAQTSQEQSEEEEEERTSQQAPQRVAIVHWGMAESLFIFDMEALGVVLPFSQAQSSLLNHDFYRPYVDKLNEVVVVGENTAVNLEALLSFEPDLIIAGNQTNVDILDQLEQIATTEIIDETVTNVYQDWPYVIERIGEILGQAETASAFTEQFYQLAQEEAQQAGAIEGEVLFVQVREKQMYIQPAVYLSEYFDAFSLTPVESDMLEISLEGLSTIDPDHLFLGFFNMEDTLLPAITDEWQDSSVWQQLNAVRNEQAYPINGQVAYSYGPLSRMYGLEVIGDILNETGN